MTVLLESRWAQSIRVGADKREDSGWMSAERSITD